MSLVRCSRDHPCGVPPIFFHYVRVLKKRACPPRPRNVALRGVPVGGWAAPSARKYSIKLAGGSAPPQISLLDLLPFCPSSEKISLRRGSRDRPCGVPPIFFHYVRVVKKRGAWG